MARDGSDPGRDLADAIGSYVSPLAPEAWNPSFCTCPGPETTNIQPDLQNGGQTLNAFVSQTPGGPSGAIIQSEWGLDLSSPPPLCSLSLGPLSRRKRLERGSFACFASGSGWATRSGKGRRGEGEKERGPRAGEQKVPRQSCLRSCRRARAHCPGRRGRGPAWASLHTPGG